MFVYFAGPLSDPSPERREALAKISQVETYVYKHEKFRHLAHPFPNFMGVKNPKFVLNFRLQSSPLTRPQLEAQQHI